MSAMIPALLAAVLGLIGLVWGADRFVAGSAGAARNFGISPLVIGLTFVSIGTSAPEIIVAINAALKDAGDMAVGNALGSNLANIGLVLGITALVAPLPTQRHLLKQEGLALIAVTLLAGILLVDGRLGRLDGILLLGLLAPLLWATIYYKKSQLLPAEKAAEEEQIPVLATHIAIIWFIVGLAIMLASSEALVWGAKEIAASLGVSQLVIGLTVVAVGTSLPELAASVMSAMRGHHDIALGNIIGSNLFNLMAVMSVPGIIAPLDLDASVFYRDYLAMTALTGILIFAIWLSLRNNNSKKSGYLGRRLGALLLGLYGLYYVALFAST